MKKSIQDVALVFAMVAFAGCDAIQNGCRESSDSSGSDSGSRSLGSNAGVHTSASYERDVYSFTVACVSREQSCGELLPAVSRIAELHGISDWQTEPATLSALQAVVLEGQLDESGLARLRAELAPLGPAVIANAFQEQAPDDGERRGVR
jgi:hypothetical protein